MTLFIGQHKFEALKIGDQSLTDVLDGYGSNISEHHAQQEQINDTIIQALDGYALAPEVGSGADGYVAFFTGPSSVAGDNDLFWDRDNNRLGVGTSTPAVKLQVAGNISARAAGGSAGSEQFGEGASATATNATAVGKDAVATGAQSVALGKDATAISTGGISIGQEANFDIVGVGQGSISIGRFTQTPATQATALGDGAFAQSNGSLAIGVNAGTGYIDNTKTHQVVVGNGARAASHQSIAIGVAAAAGNTNTNASSAIAIGDAATSDGIDSIAIGRVASASKNNSFAIGAGAVTSADNQGVFGNSVIPIDLVNFGSFGLGTPSTAQNFKLEVAGNVGPNVDDAYSLGSLAFRWQDGYFGPGTLHFVQNAGENDLGVNRDWTVNVDSSGNFRIKQAADNFAILRADTSNSMAIGQGATAQFDNSVVVGHSATMGGASTAQTDNVVIGRGANTNISGSNVGNAVVIGSGATVTRENAVAIGQGASASAASVAIGRSSNALSGIAIGSSAIHNDASASNLVIGTSSSVTGGTTIMIGSGSQCSSGTGLVIGHSTFLGSSRSNSIVIGHNIGSASIGGATSILIGNGARVGVNGVAVGINANSSSTPSVATVSLGNAAQAILANTTAVGSSASAANTGATAIGDGAIAGHATSGTNSTAVGYLASAGNAASVTNTVAIGQAAQATASSNTAIGQNAQAVNSPDSTVVGMSALANGGDGVAIGRSASSTANRAVAVGRNSTASQSEATALGYASAAQQVQAVGIGAFSNANQIGATALGALATATGTGATSVGSSASASVTNGIAIGSSTTAAATNTVVIGAAVSTTVGATNATIVGKPAASISSADVTAIGHNTTVSTAARVVVIGHNAIAQSDDNTAVGRGAQVTGLQSTALGSGTVATGSSTVSVGFGASSTGSANTAIGHNSVTGSSGSNTAIGKSAQAGDSSNNNSVAIGETALATALRAIAVGADAAAASTNSIAIGQGSSAGPLGTNPNCIAIGFGTQANGTNGATAVGSTATASAAQSTALGKDTVANQTNATAVGYSADATGSDSTAVGSQSTASNSSATGIGASVTASGSGSTAIGASVTASGSSTVAIGSGSSAVGNSSVAIGQNTQAQTGATNAVLIGQGVQTTNSGVVAIGQGVGTNIGISTVTIGNTASTAAGTSSVAIGTGATATSSHSVALGASSVATGTNGSTALGRDAQATGADSTSVGHGPIVQATNAVVVSSASMTVTSAGSAATIVGKTTGSVTGANVTGVGHNVNIGAGVADTTAIGANAVASTLNSTAIGASASAAGTNGTTAVGRSASASGTDSTAIGRNTVASGSTTTAVGFSADATQPTASAFGANAQATGAGATAVGNNAQATANDSTAVGLSAVASQTLATAIGDGATASASSATVVGQGATASASNCVVLGQGSSAITNSNSIVVGAGGHSASGGSTVLINATGTGRTHSGLGGIFIGSQDANISANKMILIGHDTSWNNIGGFCVGLGDNVSTGGTASVAIGRNTIATGTDTVSIGTNASSTGANSISIGGSATTSSFTNSVAIGQGATAIGDNDGVIGTPTSAIGLRGYGLLDWRTDGYFDGYLMPFTDNVHWLGTPDKRWNSLFVGPGSLHLSQKASENDIGVERDWTIRIDPALGDLVFRQGENDKIRFSNEAADAARPTIAFGDGDSGFFELADDIIQVSLDGLQRWTFSADDFRSANNDGPTIQNEQATATNPVYAFRFDLDTGIGKAGDDQVSLIAGGFEGVRISEAIGAITVGINGNTTIGAAYGGTPFASYDDLVVQGTSTSGITIGSGNTSFGAILFADADSNLAGNIIFEHNTDQLQLGTAGSTRIYLSTTGLTVNTGNRFVVPQADAPTAPTIAFGDADSGFYETADDNINVSIGGAAQYQWSGDTFRGLDTNGPKFRNIPATSTQPNIFSNNLDSNTGMGSAGEDTISLIAAGYEALRITGNATNISATVDAYGDLLLHNNTRITNSDEVLNLGAMANTSHSLGINDVIVGGSLEVETNLWVDGTALAVAYNGPSGLVFVQSPVVFHSGEQSPILAANHTFDQWGIFTGAPSGNQMLVASQSFYNTRDFDHPHQANPAVFIHSNTDPDIDNSQWLALYHDQLSGWIETGKGAITVAPYDGYVLPAADDAYSLGSQSFRWKDLWVGPNTLHIYQSAAENELGIERSWQLGINSVGDFFIRQSDTNFIAAGINNDTLTIGIGALAFAGPRNTAIGSNVNINNVNGNNTGIGYNAFIEAGTGVAIGTNAAITGTGSHSSVVIGTDADTASSQSVVIGYSASIGAGFGSTIAIGYNSSISGTNAISIGSSSGASQNAISIGHSGTVGAQSIAIGIGTANGSTEAIVFGYSSQSAANESVTIGVNSLTTSGTGNGTGSVAIGSGAQSDGGGVAIGKGAIANNTSVGSRSVAIGYGATTGTFTNALALGAGATVTANNEGQIGTAGQPLSIKTYGPMTIGGTDVGLRRGAAGILEISDGGAVNFGTLRMGAIGTTINSSGAVTFGAALHQMNDGGALAWGGNGANGTIWYIDHSMAQLAFYLGSDISRSLVIGSRAAYAQDFDHAVQTDPALFIHSATAPDTDNTQWIGLQHNKLDGYIYTGTGDLVLAPFGANVVPGSATTGLGEFDNPWADGYFTDLNTKGAVNGIINIESADSPFLARQDDYTIICDASAGTITVVLPSAGGANKGRIYNIKKIDATNNVTIQASGLENIDGANSVTLTTQYKSRQIQSDGSSWNVIGGVF